MEPTELIVWGGAAAAATYHPIVQRVLGPTADYLGQALSTCTEKGAQNLGRIMHHAIKKLGTRIDREESVPPKVMKSLLLDAPFIEDELSAEYFGGVLASSRSGVSRDDRAATLMALLARLSTYQLRTHYIIYSEVKRQFNGSSLDVGEQVVRERTFVLIPLDAYIRAMDFTQDENVSPILDHAVFGLLAEDLIDTEQYACGSHEHVRAVFPAAESGGLYVGPSSRGAELFLWAHARADLDVSDFLDSSVRLEFDTPLETLGSA